MRLKQLVCLAVLLSIAAPWSASTAFGQAHSSSRQTRAAMQQLQKDEFRAHMAFLADDLLEGRGTGTRGHEIAARYIAAQFETLGLLPAGDHGGFYQRVPLREITVNNDKSQVTIMRDGRADDLVWGTDFLIRVNVKSTDVAIDAPVVFVGFGVSTLFGKYDDYAGLDVTGKIVAVLNGAPASLTSTELRAHVSAIQEKLRVASEHGAVGLISLRTAEFEKTRQPWTRAVRAATLPEMHWVGPADEIGDAFRGLSVSAQLSPAASERLFANADKSWIDVQRDATASRQQSFPLKLSVRLRAVTTQKDLSSPNVAAVLPGSDPTRRQEYVIYTAHADHLGIGPPVNGDSIYNGAADDASGTAALLVLAKAFKSMEHAPARSILFLVVTGEEKGHLGSEYFAQHPTVPIRSIVANLNIDGASLFYTFKDVVAIGAADSTLDRVVKHSAAELGLTVSPDPAPEQNYFVRSDQYSFVRQGVPALYIGEGYQARDRSIDGKKVSEAWGASRYHMPSDDMNQPFNFDASVEFMQLEFLVGYEIAQQVQRPAWKPGDFFGETFGRK
jgi:hypothetical protein